MAASKNTALVWIEHYLFGCFASVWNGIFSTAYVSFGAAGANAAGLVDLHAISLRGFLSTLAGTILFHAVIYFYNHRIPDELPDGTSAPENLASAMRTSIPAVAPVTTEPKQNP